MIRLEPGDMLSVIPRLVAEGVVCDAVVTDPPYHLVAAAARANAPMKAGPMQRMLKGFMGQTWDSGDIAFRAETWATVATILRPGAFLIAFGGTRTYHRLVTAIEDAGFIIKDQVAWLFGSGFPKRRDMLKPAFEPICLAYKPGGKRTLQVDECRVASDGDHIRNGPIVRQTSLSGDERNGAAAGMFEPGSVFYAKQSPDGRWPANVCHDGSEEVIEAFPEGHSGGDHPKKRGAGEWWGVNGGGKGHEHRFINDTGSAARFFYCAKADKQDRWGSRHPTVKPVELMKWLVPLVTPPNGLVLDPFAGSGTTGVAALATGRDCILIEREAAYIEDIRQRLAFYEGGGAHSVKAKNRSRVEFVREGDLFAPKSKHRPDGELWLGLHPHGERA